MQRRKCPVSKGRDEHHKLTARRPLSRAQAQQPAQRGALVQMVMVMVVMVGAWYLRDDARLLQQIGLDITASKLTSRIEMNSDELSETRGVVVT